MSSRCAFPRGEHRAAAVVLLPMVCRRGSLPIRPRPNQGIALGALHPPCDTRIQPRGAASAGGGVRRPAWNVVLVNRVLRYEPDHVALGGVVCASAVPHLRAANIDPESSLNPTSEKIVAGICTGKSVFMGFPAHISATIGTASDQRAVKLFFQPVTHKVTGRVGGLWTKLRQNPIVSAARSL